MREGNCLIGPARISATHNNWLCTKPDEMKGPAGPGTCPLPPKADITEHCAHVRFMPKADIGTLTSLNHRDAVSSL